MLVRIYLGMDKSDESKVTPLEKTTVYIKCFCVLYYLDFAETKIQVEIG